MSQVPSRRPPEVKQYEPGLTTVELPTDLPDHGVPAEEVLSGSAGPSSRRLDLGELARLLFYSAGVVRWVDTPGFGRLHTRAAGSAGNLHPLEVYVVATGMEGVPDGVWHHDPFGHRLRRVADAPGEGPPYLVVTGIPWRTGWKYAERGYRHLWWDAGTMLSQLLALAETTGAGARLRLAFPDRDVAALVGADGVHELPLAVVALGEGRPRFEAPGRAAAGLVAEDPLELPLVTDTHRATEAAGGAWLQEPDGAEGPAPVPPGPTPPAGQGLRPGWTLEEVILRRGSTRRFDRAATLPAGSLSFAMAVATRPLPWDVGHSLGEHHLVVHSVDGLPSGLYRWADGGPTLVHTGDLRASARHFCLDQDLAGDAGYIAAHCADIDAVVEELGERGYRAAQLEAGVTEGRLHLAAFALGHGASGLTFYDDLTTPFLRTAAAGMLVTAVGTPAYRSVGGGPPGRPARIRGR
ncbi:MAG: SagB family peptide dehydrogenase [Acidimicrobiales bacterium]